MSFTRNHENTLRSVKNALALAETEDTWDRIAAALSAFETLLQECGGDIPGELVETMRSLSSPITKSIMSERSRLSGCGMGLLATAANELGKSFEPLVPVFFPTLLILCGRPNKVFATRAKASLMAIIQHTQSPHILSVLLRYAKDKSTPLRLTAGEAALACLQCFNPPDLQKESRGQEVEALIKCFATDANAEVRKVGRRIFEAYSTLMPGRVDRFVAPLTPIMKKYLALNTKSISNAIAPSHDATYLPISVGIGQQHPRPHSVIAGNEGERPGRDPVKAMPITHNEYIRPSSRAAHERAAPSAPKRPNSVLNMTSQDSGAMPPPAAIPARPRQDGAPRIQDAAVLPSLQGPSSNPSRSKMGPIRPSAQLPGNTTRPVTPQDDQLELRRTAGGARRVLRTEPSLSDSQPSTSEAQAKSAVPPRRVEPVGQTRERTVPTQGKKPLLATRAAVSTTTRATKSSGNKPPLDQHAPGVTTRPGKVGRPPSTRANSNTSDAGQSRVINKSSKRTADTVKGRGQPSTNQQKTMKSRAPELVPLPPSRSHTPDAMVERTRAIDKTSNRHHETAGHMLPESHAAAISTAGETLHYAQNEELEAEDHAAHDSASARPLETPSSDQYPVTPQARESRMEGNTVQQTPISALVESIQQGFLFTSAAGSLHTVEEVDSFDNSMQMEAMFPAVENVPTWECKPLAYSKPS
ncbi:clasp N terminal-domain-containing protein [Phanerochaete sordida]|uniref:Clasp N terminal-domain-containing protein n=1 Tax=Phanerochaete sordida TaxID=48140 RepID=A0A9P3GGZ6_9APHY|nr:clasp N terminal-domain-containing protein [Phanerochaete sordida]